MNKYTPVVSVHQVLISGRNGVLSTKKKKMFPLILRRDDVPQYFINLEGESVLVVEVVLVQVSCC